ncbi:hypothetical protein M406DRAFT_337672 [Cryphonectria parasitica EP155]|uniref:Uncharacterized protein n=1 Tax=Cryphonectria parasitica (strain ATCC 38755 / EP155) TaxID=660469 RepID=A0A9P4Y4X2_CRYP1|nr:uncharacterized protein M406DRAFT_337672 [Cryphonectria parasitica EP155]KAF3766726.1 hypothetical protein M406DRAFT_337672 [Cryphonectria parasitica EP155]
MTNLSDIVTARPVPWEKTAALIATISLPTSPLSQRYLVASPYVEQEHLLDLETLDMESQILSEALAGMAPVRDDYATASYDEAFNWDEVILRMRELAMARRHAFRKTSWYIVAFRSQIKVTTVYPDLGALDKAAHAEAMASGGFLKYWFGTPNEDLRNLATCIWRSQEDAKKGSVGPDHRRAAGAARSMYSEWKIDQHRLIIDDGVNNWKIVKWT